MRRHREKMVVCKPRRGAWTRFFPHSPQKELTLSGPWFQTSSLQNGEAINHCRLSHLVCSTCYDRPSRLIYWIPCSSSHWGCDFLTKYTNVTWTLPLSILGEGQWDKWRQQAPLLIPCFQTPSFLRLKTFTRVRSTDASITRLIIQADIGIQGP